MSLQTTYHSDGSIASTFTPNNDGRYEGEFILYYPNGRVHEKQNYRNGQPDGEWITYYSNGDVQRKETHQYREPLQNAYDFIYVNQTDLAGRLFRREDVIRN